MIASHTALATAFLAAREVEVWLHEIDYRWGRGSSPAAVAARRLWSTVDRVMVHTEVERRDFVDAFGVRPDRVAIGAHGAHFVRRTRHDRASARASLGLPPDAVCFLSIGFVAPHKGFDRAVAAFVAGGLAEHGCRLYVVGSVRLDDPTLAGYVADLEAAVERAEGVELVEGYVSDELFDRWLVAADVVVLPYRNIWSSGVLERAALYDRPVVATDVGGLAQQAASRSVSVTLVPVGSGADTGVVPGLAAAMRELAGVRADRVPVAAEPWPVAEGRTGVQAAVAERAARRRGSGARSGSPSGSPPWSPSGAPVGSAAGGARVARLGEAGGSSAPVRRLAPLALPPASSTRLSAHLVKSTVRRLTGWQLEPVVHQVNALRDAVIAALDQRRG
jgi:hypothetical protein